MPMACLKARPNRPLIVRKNWIAASENVGVRPRLPLAVPHHCRSRSSQIVSDLKGRPPRTKFWAKDLTVRHEKYHVKDFVDIGKSSATGAETWLAGQNAAKKEDVPALLDKAWNDKIFKEWDKFTDPPKVEERAYDDGVASYKARAAAIKAKGDKGGYP